MEKEPLRTPDAARYLGVKPNTLAVWRVKNKGPKYHKMGKIIIYLREDLDTYIASNVVQTIDTTRRGI